MLSSFQTKKYSETKREIKTDISLKGLSDLVYEGSFANVFVILTGGVFLTGLALLMGANDFQIGLLAAIPFLLQSSQLLSPFIFKDSLKNRRRIISILGISRIIWLLVIPIIFIKGWWQFPVLIGIVSLSGLLTMLCSPVWLNWMADIVPESIRGRFFSHRNAAIALTTITCTILGSLILDYSRSEVSEDFGFSAIMLLAIVGALLSFRSMKKIPRVGDKGIIRKAPKPDLRAPLRDKIFRRILIVFGFWNIAVGMSAAFFAPHMLLNLEMSFFQIGLYSCGTALVGILSSRLWGKLIDRVGCKPILNLCAFGIGCIPLVWLFITKSSIWILIPEAFYSGILWSGFNVAAFTFPIDKSPRNDRTLFLSVFAAVTGLTFFAASFVSGLAAENLAEWHINILEHNFINYHLLFALSAIVRLLTAGLITSFHEPRDIRLPVVIQLMGYAVLKRMSIGRQIFPFAVDSESSVDNNENRNNHKQ